MSDLGEPTSVRPSMAAVLSAAMVVVSLAAVNPFGWDRFGPIRWMLLPPLILSAAAVAVNRERPVAGAASARANVRRAGWCWAVVLGVGWLSASFGVDRLHAFIGTPDRHLGWITWLLFAVVFFVGIDIGDAGDRSVALVLRSIAVAAVLMGVYVIAEWLGAAVDVSFADGRLGGPFGQPAFLGAAAALAMPIAVGVAVDGEQSVWWRGIGALGGAFGMVALLTSQTRAAWVGVFVAVIVVLVVRRTDVVRFVRPRWWVPVVAALGGAAVALLTPVGSRALSLFDSGGVLQGRTDEWQVALRALGEKPILGHGPEGYRIAFGTHVDPEYVLAHGRDTITDRAHSGILDVAVSMGIVVAAAYVALVALVMGAAVRLMRSRVAARHIGWAVGLIAFAVQQLFLFPVAELDPVFWLLSGMAMSHAWGSEFSAGSGSVASSESRASLEAVGASRLPVIASGRFAGVARVVGPGLLAGLAVITGVAGVVELSADRSVRVAVDQRDSDPVRSNQLAERAVDRRPDSIRYRFIAARLAVPRIASLPGFDAAVSHIEAGLNLSPRDPALREELASLHLDRARSTADPAVRIIELNRAAETLQELIADDPRHPRHRRALGVARTLLGEFTDAREQFEAAAALDPDNEEYQLDLAELQRLVDESGR